MDNPIIIIVLAGVLLAVLLVLRKKEKAKQAKSKPVKQTGEAKVNKGKKPTEKPAEAAKAEEVEEENFDEIGDFDSETDWSTNAPVSVSVQQVDSQTEYQVYKEFGYLDKAAEALASYLKVIPVQPKEQVLELLTLWLEVGDVEKFVEELSFFKDQFTREDLETLIREGLAVESNNLSLRVFAAEEIGWDVDEINDEIGTNDALENVIQQQVEKEKKAPSTIAAAAPKISEPQVEVSLPEGAQVDRKAYRLIKGKEKLEDLTNDEITIIESFLPAAKSAKLLTGHVNYPRLVEHYNLAIDTTERPATLLIDALKVDYQYRNLNNFAYHLWRLYQVLGRHGQAVKERMLGLGYTLGRHPSFVNLLQSETEQGLRNVGLAYGFVKDVNAEQKNRLELVQKNKNVEVLPTDISSEENDLNRILSEAEAELTYGELDGAMTTLEEGIFNLKDEPQLYMMLFNLYERAEAWERFDDFSKRLRREIKELPEEVLLFMSRLSQASAMKKVIS